MAKERNLPSKTTLTTSDYIRVVGSDNASYKQQVSNVANTIVENAYLTPPTALSSGANLLTLAVGVYYTPSNDVANSLVNKPSDLSLNCRVEVLSRIPARRAIIVTDSANNVWENQMDSDSSWTGWKKRPTRAEIEVLETTVTGTTNQFGAINLNLPWRNYEIIAIASSNGNHWCIPTIVGASTYARVLVDGASWTPAGNTSVSLTVRYRHYSQ